MPVMNEVQEFTRVLFSDWSLSGSTSLALALFLYFFASWLVCFAAAFCRVRETNYYVGLLSVGLTLLVSMLLAGLCRYYVPDLANSFTPWGLLVFSSVVGVFVFSVPLIQSFWKTTYLQGLACMAGGILLFLGVMIATQVMVHPAESLPARLSVPLFEPYAPGMQR